jgi:hypothetical protein
MVFLIPPNDSKVPNIRPRNLPSTTLTVSVFVIVTIRSGCSIITIIINFTIFCSFLFYNTTIIQDHRVLKRGWMLNDVLKYIMKAAAEDTPTFAWRKWRKGQLTTPKALVEVLTRSMLKRSLQHHSTKPTCPIFPIHYSLINHDYTAPFNKPRLNKIHCSSTGSIPHTKPGLGKLPQSIY